MSKLHKILFITYPPQFKTASRVFDVCTDLDLEVFHYLGYETKVVRLWGNPSHFISDLLSLSSLSKEYQLVYIIADGQANLDKFALIKILNPRSLIIWEIHGLASERLWLSNTLQARCVVILKKIQRRFHSNFVSGSICLSEPLSDYSKEKLGINHSFTIPSYYLKKDNQDLVVSNTKINSMLKKLKSKTGFYVLWGGTAELRWQALDLIELVARKIYKINKNITFIIVGSNRWHKFNFTKNIVFFESMFHSEFTQILSKVDICLALYHSLDSKSVTGLNFYFSPRKIIEGMCFGKVVIATRDESTKYFVRNGVNGFLTNNDPDEISQIINMLSKNPLKLKEVGESAEKTAKLFDLKHSAMKYEKAISSILANTNI